MPEPEVFANHNVFCMKQIRENFLDKYFRLHLFYGQKRTFNQIIHSSVQTDGTLFIHHQFFLVKVTHFFEFGHLEKTNNTF